ncbi:MAG: hypothetical protein BJ554DRAFT_6112 [Olpidium bornovanus]|uniref:Polysaccharide lyase 14 domain-containing protein n=1 Tax=Olpidium bornovanus TaxID=278681 RepID=A0A8H7ZYQ4_9FUNG|nr:MAG: hypothetical protein BJ554DRAFT_6112 [Olpidium bornovanus]
MSGKSLGPFNVISDTWGGGYPNLNREFAADPTNPKNVVLKVKYPKGTTTPTSKFNPPGRRGGVGFYGRPIPPEILSKAKQVSLEYSVYFPEDFDFVRGGKLPGLYGGVGNARGCSGGSAAADCYSARFMWRKGGNGEAYLYTPAGASQDPGYCKVPPVSVCDPQYGDSIARNSFKFALGSWTRIKVTVALNDIGKKNGLVQLSANGKQVASFDKVVWRTKPDVVTVGVMVRGWLCCESATERAGLPLWAEGGGGGGGGGGGAGGGGGGGGKPARARV